jgi:hypothetical protein
MNAAVIIIYTSLMAAFGIAFWREDRKLRAQERPFTDAELQAHIEAWRKEMTP